MNGVNRLATKGKKYYRLTTKSEKNYLLPTGKLLTDYRHGPTLSIFFSERRVYCIFSTFLGSNNQRYLPAHIFRLVTHRFVKRVRGKCFKIHKNAWCLMMDRGYQHNLKDKLQSETEMKLTETEVRARGGNPIYGLYRYVPRNRVWFFRFSVLK